VIKKHIRVILSLSITMKVIIEGGQESKKYKFIDEEDTNSNSSNEENNTQNHLLSAIHTGTIKRYDLDVEYEEKDIYKKLGARWDGNNKTWYWVGQRSKMPHALKLKLKPN